MCAYWSLVEPMAARGFAAAQGFEGILAQAEGLAEGAGRVKQRMPEARAEERAHGVTRAADAAFGGSEPKKAVGADACWAERVGGVLNGVQVVPATSSAKICARGFIVPDACQALRMIAIVMILMHGADSLGGVHDREAFGGGFPNQ